MQIGLFAAHFVCMIKNHLTMPLDFVELASIYIYIYMNKTYTVVVDVNNFKNSKEASEGTEESPAGCAGEGRAHSCYYE